MALYYEQPAYRDTYRLILEIFECTKEFSKEYQYSLGQDMRRHALTKETSYRLALSQSVVRRFIDASKVVQQQ